MSYCTFDLGPSLNRREYRIAKALWSMCDSQIRSVVDHGEYLSLSQLCKVSKMPWLLRPKPIKEEEAHFSEFIVCQRYLKTREEEMRNCFYLLAVPASRKALRAVLRESSGRFFATKERFSCLQPPPEGDVAELPVRGFPLPRSSEHDRVVFDVYLPRCYGLEIWAQLGCSRVGDRAITEELLFDQAQDRPWDGGED